MFLSEGGCLGACIYVYHTRDFPKKTPREARTTIPYWAVSYFGTRQFGVWEPQVNARRVDNSHLPHHDFGTIVQQELGVFVLSILGAM